MEKLFQVKKTQIEMLQDRGYDVSAELPILSTTFESFNRTYTDYATANGLTIREVLRQIYHKGNEKILVYYIESIDGKNIGIDLAKIFISYLTSVKVLNAILISDQPINSNVQTEFNSLPMYKISVFLENELMYNPTKHFLVPRHELLTEAEARDFYRTNRFKPSQLPNMFVTDRIARHYGAKPGDTFRIYQKSMVNDSMTEMSVSYRYVSGTPPPTKKK